MKSLTDFIKAELPDWAQVDPSAPRKANFGAYDKYAHDRKKCRICLAGRDHLRYCGRAKGKRYWRGSFAKIHNAALELGGRGRDVHYAQIGSSLYWLLTLPEPPIEPPGWWTARTNEDPLRF